ncbi:hypothetical protein MJN69_30835, partial [Salmonella enterica subsp. enterica serovar Kentucky]|nr:hypothetical protein [Salmonella enterica subsp. enterica serovar Kentucky]
LHSFLFSQQAKPHAAIDALFSALLPFGQPFTLGIGDEFYLQAHELLQAGVTQFSRETFSSALELGRKTLVSLGMHPHQAQRA